MWEDFVCHRMAHLRAYTVLLTAEPLRGSTLVLSLSATYGPHALRGASGGGGYPVTAWRTSCLYGVTYCRASPRLFLGAIFVCYIRTARSPRCECVGGLRLSPHGALRAYTVLLTAEPRRGSSLVLSLSATYRPHLPEVRMCVGGLRLSPHGALTCLYGVSYS